MQSVYSVAPGDWVKRAMAAILWGCRKDLGPSLIIIKDRLNGLVTESHGKYLRASSIEECEIPTTELSLRKIVSATLVGCSDSDSKSGGEQADLLVCKCRHLRENSDDESDVSSVERRIMIRSRTANKNVSIVYTEVSMKGKASNLSTHKDDFLERDLLQL